MAGMTYRAVLVTGASRGIGRAVATAFAAGGDRVAIHHRDSADAAEELRAELPGDGHVVVRADLTDPDAVRAMVDEAAELLGGLDVLVNNAGVYGDRDEPHPIFGASYEQWQQRWRQVLETNLTGAGQRHLVRRPAHARTRRPDRQRLVPWCVPGRAGAAGVRRQQGGAERAGSVARRGARAVRHHGRHGRARASWRPT